MKGILILHRVRRAVSTIILVTCVFCTPHQAVGRQPGTGPILIISSYNPETATVANNISQFMDEYELLGGKHPIAIENMNCKSFSEIHEWSARMRGFLQKYNNGERPALILLLGQEAWSSYISQPYDVLDRSIPVLCGMVSRNAILMPSGQVDLREWEPESVDVLDDLDSENIVSGYLYEYNVDKNISLIRSLYPAIENLAFITDNSYGGVSIQAHVKRQMRNHPDINLVLLDGRKFTMASIIRQIETLPANTAMLLGTWRVDSDENYFISNALYDLANANPKVPCFTLTSIGLERGAIGGYVPQYRSIGKDLAHQAWEYIDQAAHLHSGRSIQYIPNHYIFDYKRLEVLGIAENSLPEPHTLVNRDASFVERYKYQIFAVASLFALLLAGYLVVFYYYFRIKKLKDALEQSESDNILILNNLRADIKFITPDYIIKWYNNSTVGGTITTALPHAGAQGQPCHKVLHGLDQPCHFCPVNEALAAGRSVENTIEMPGGQFITMLASPVYGERNELMGIVVRTEDVTGDKERERELRLAKERAEESDRLKTAFLANMSHEIRTPLNAIVGFSSVLVAEGTSDEERRMYSDIVQTNSELLLRLINDILDISRLEMGRLTFNYAPCELISLCQSVISTTQYSRESKVEYILDAPFESFELMTDVQRLQQVLINLMSNAVKFTTEGKITLAVHPDKENDRVVFSVTDTGCGIPLEKQKKVFERFEKLDEYVQGTGLGLAICRLTVGMLGGEIWIDDGYTAGARFIFTHPLTPKNISEGPVDIAEGVV